MSAVLEPEVIAPNVLINSTAFNFDLTITQRLFADNYLETRNGFESAKLAGYGGNDATLRAIASENLTKPNIKAYLESRFSELVIGSNETLAELSQIARFDVISNPEGPIKPSDKLKALDLAGKFYKLWDKPAETSTDEQGATRELITILQTLTARAKELQAQPATEPQLIPASVGEHTP